MREANDIHIEERGQTALVRLNRPRDLNRLTGSMLERLAAAFAGFGDESNLRAVILTGAGVAFSAGAGVDDLDAEAGGETARAISGRVEAVCGVIESCGVPVVAAVNGLAAGAGCKLALACHLRVASVGARFQLTQAELESVASDDARRSFALLTGKDHPTAATKFREGLSAGEAARLGLINRVVEPSAVLSAAEEFASEIAAHAPLAARACLQAVTRGSRLPLEEGLKLERELFSRLFETEDAREGTSAFLEKRAPVFKGK